ncbi:FG-GAP repeat domain-containing protein [Cohnella zeiphila]|uniref:VCBS repeat-containing protein n=1 Tax=Cohnella zeiphila TaxID=2761120 RepID=A0A7X0SRG9_9BACL|nr:VCBS repeat-containing protein [Cohnella zeiphila]MBB6734803.1 VCBS repeat-containing protein [Cohnella zeiphila]
MEMKWTHFTIDGNLPGSAWGTGVIGLADFDGDGDLDVIVSRRETQTAYWFERKDDAVWVRHTVGTSPHLAEALGGVAVDVDQDGLIDYVTHRVWFRNPGNLHVDPDAPWEAHPFEGGGHDIIAADINGDGKLDIVCYDGDVLSWFDTSNGLARTIIAEGRDDHGGVAPCGVGDLNGDGLPDIVLPGVWYENPGNGSGEWKRHEWPHSPIKNASYGTCIRVWIADINGDGRNDIVYSDCDTGYSHVYWVENLDRGDNWIVHRLPDPPGHPDTGSFHSLAVADFNHDGRLEIFAAEQEDPDRGMMDAGRLPMKPEGLLERGVFWMNRGGNPPVFEPVVIHEGRPGWHDAVVGDVNGDGSLDIVSKIWNAVGPTYHVDFWRNDTLRKSDGDRTPECFSQP